MRTMTIDFGYATISYGHCLAHQIRRAVESIPPGDRPAVAGRIRIESSIRSLMGIRVAEPKAIAYATDLLNGRRPRQPLGHQHRNRR